MTEKKETAPAVVPAKKELALQSDFAELYTVVRGGQIMEPVRGKITLFKNLGHLYEQKKDSGDWRITALGYRYLNKVASISLVTPSTVIVDGKPWPNPHIERDRKTKAIQSVNMRRMGIGFSPLGQIVVIDKTLFYNIYTYFLQSIQAKMNRGGGAEYAFYGTADAKPTKSGAWAWYSVEPPLGIWINYENSAMLDCLQEHTQRQRFGDRMAATILDRNILKDHPAIAAAQVYAKTGEGGVKALVVVYGYRNSLEPRNIKQIAEQAELDDNVEVKRETIVEVKPEEEKEALEEEVETPSDTPAEEGK